MQSCRLVTRVLPVTLCGLVTASLGCPGKFADGPPGANRMRTGHAPTPFSVDELRKSCREGVWRLYRVATAGRPPSYRILRFERANKAGTIVVSVK